jgi:formylglycine-generating enzyme required for sulfatase activity
MNKRMIIWVFPFALLGVGLMVISGVTRSQDKAAIQSNYIETACGINLQMVFVQGGKFMMGSKDGGSDEKPVHPVILSDFFIGKFEVTERQWQYVMGKNPSFFKGCDDCPVEQVSWNDVQEFIRKLNRKSGKNYRLPTEAEWEYAAKGGNKSKGFTYSGSDSISDVAWYNKNSDSKTHLVGQKQPNELGLYDMSGNVLEWCNDWYGRYLSGSQTNPKGPATGDSRVYRGGGWGYLNRSCRTSNRDRSGPRSHSFNLGFRVAAPTS